MTQLKILSIHNYLYTSITCLGCSTSQALDEKLDDHTNLNCSPSQPSSEYFVCCNIICKYVIDF